MTENQGHRHTLSMRRKPDPRFDYNKKKSGAQRAMSHDKDIRRYKETGEKVKLQLLSGIEITGTVKDSDRYTIKINANGEERIYFKHSIEFMSVAGV